MLASYPRALNLAAALLVSCAFASPSLAQAPAPAKPATTTTTTKKPAAKKPTTTSKPKPKTATAAKKPVKPAPPPPPPPPPPVELIGIIVMPPDAFRAGPPTGQYDNEGRRAAAPRFEAQPVQGVSSIKPGATGGAWWALSDNGFGGKWNSSDYRLCVYLFDVRPRTEAGTDSRNALQAVIELSDPAKFFPWRLADENSPERVLTGLDADPESLVTMPDDSFWIGDEFGPWLLHFSDDGELLAPPVELPDNVRSVDHPLAITKADIPRLPHSRGFEAMDLAGDNQTLVSILEGTVGGDAPKTLRLQRYDTAAGKWLSPTLIYELDHDATSVTDMSLIEGNRFVVMERDDLQGDAAKAKRVYSIDLDRAVPGKPLAKKLVIDLLAIGNSRGLVVTSPAGAPFRFPYLTPESIQVLDRKHVVIVNDNNYPATGGRGANVKDATEWIWLELGNPL
jgi:glycerophosphoryl diester phosphodiesterase